MSKREDADPKRIDHVIHENGIFDLQWSPDDTWLATCSGDHTTRITDVTTGKTLHILRGHTSTVKTVIWDPQHASLLSTGGRDGGIRVWDLRIAASTTHGLTSHSPRGQSLAWCTPRGDRKVSFPADRLTGYCDFGTCDNQSRFLKPKGRSDQCNQRPCLRSTQLSPKVHDEHED